MNSCIKMLATISVVAAVSWFVSISAFATQGDVFAAGTVYCARTYSGHPNYFKGSSSDDYVVDIGRVAWLPLYAPESGQVSQVSWDNGQGTGWGNAIIWTSADGREKLHLAHLKEVKKTGQVQGGDLIGYVGSTGKSDGPHLHISRSLDGVPVQLELSGQPIIPDTDYTACNASYTSKGPISNGLIRAQGDIQVFWRQNGKRYHVLNPDILNAMAGMTGWSWNQITELSWDEISSIPEGPAFIAPDYRSEGILIRQKGTDPVYRVENGGLRHILFDECVQMNCWADVIDVTAEIMNLFPVGVTVDLFAGWNMISSVGGDFSLNELFASSNCIIVDGPYWYNGNDYEQPSYLEPDKGYWVEVVDRCTANFPKGPMLEGLSPLHTGWNMISPIAQNIPVSDFLSSDCLMAGGLWWYNASINNYIKPDILEPNKGYWVYVEDTNCLVGLQVAPYHLGKLGPSAVPPPPPPPPNGDDDGDGVPNNKDKCPGTPKNTPVDANGCSTTGTQDDDGDGVPNNQDQCPGTPKGTPVDANGCPTTKQDDDGDGVPNDKDQCPGTPRNTPVDNKGCPATTPDDDGDGVPNDRDKCPGTSAGTPVDANGCPKILPPPSDQDGDGIPDSQDKCPGTKPGTPVDSNGCPKSSSSLVAEFTYSPSNPKPGEVITFDCSPSKAPSSRKITDCDWDFHGQGAFVAELEHLRQHKFNEEGYFTVTLTVKDDSGAENYISKVITVSRTPVQDRDGDGVPDSQDRCPDQQGPVSNNGCPVSPPETLESAVDSNKSGYIEDGEILQVLNAWIKGGPFAGKFTVRESDVLSLLTKWVRREKLPVISTPPITGQSCTVTILNPLPLPGYLAGGLLWDQGTLWNSGMAVSQRDIDYSLYRINTTTGAVEPPAPLTIKGQSPTENLIRFGGITWNGKALVGAEHTGVIHFLNRSGARVGIWPRLSTAYLDIDSIRDITWDGKAIWVLVKARPANVQELSVYLLKLNDSGGVIQFTPLSESGVDGMVWDGKNFWMTDAKKDQVYQVNIEGKIQRVCTIPKELRAPRGIAWDGTNFWVLSTSNMKIYKVSIK